MEDKDRVFARFKDDKPAASDRRELLTIPRRAGAMGSRVVEVVHVRSGSAVKDRPKRVDTQVRAASWEGGFPARQASPTSVPIPTEASDAKTAQPITYVMPAWEPTPAEADAAPTVRAMEPIVAARRGRGQPRERTANAPVRRVADPFDVNDDGANCMRCGYAIEPAREKRGLMTCAGRE